MPKLNDTQLVILGQAARRKDGAVLPLPKSLKAEKPVLDKVLNTLLRQKLVEEQSAETGKPTWRHQDDRRLTLFITDAGRAAIGEDVEVVLAPEKPRQKEKPAPSKVRGSKTATLVALLRRAEGATIPDAMEATSWQAHSVRGAISGMIKKKLGLMVATAVEDGRGRVYRIVEA